MLPFAFVGLPGELLFMEFPVSIFFLLGMIALWEFLINNGRGYSYPPTMTNILQE